jgi:1,2-dihydroxy-3-keto-5-methylthiopentene dioxygenase
MTILEIPDEGRTLTDGDEIRAFLGHRGIVFERWTASAPLDRDADQTAVLAAYDHALRPYMEKHGYQTADVIRVHPEMDNLDVIRGKFLDEHTHAEDEVRFFVEGKGAFWFNLENGDTPFCVVCEAGDFISVPAGTKHWFDMGGRPHVTAIRVFSNQEGWVPHYTESDVARRYNKPYGEPL